MFEITDQVQENGRRFGGMYVPESLVGSLADLQDAFQQCWSDVSFRQDFETHLQQLRPSVQLQFLPKLSELVGGARIYLKREDLNYVGSHCIINALGQAMLAKRLQKTLILAETGSGKHGLATAAVCHRLGLECTVYMGAKAARARPEAIKKMTEYGAKVVEATSGGGKLRDAGTEVLREAVIRYETAYPLLGGAYGPSPIPMIAASFQDIMGQELKKQARDMFGALPDAVVASAGIHGPSIGVFGAFIDTRNVRLIAVEGAGDGLHSDHHAAVISNGSPGVYHGAHTMVLQDVNGQINQVHSAAPDLCYPGVSPWLAAWANDERIELCPVADSEAELGRVILSRIEGTDCSIEDGHAMVAGIEIANKMNRNENVVVCIGGGQ